MLNAHYLSQKDSVTVHQKIRPKDVPGTLLNMALLNLGSLDPNLRTAAYNLLCALTATFDLKIEGQLLETSGKISYLKFVYLICSCNGTLKRKNISYYSVFYTSFHSLYIKDIRAIRMNYRYHYMYWILIILLIRKNKYA